uniref:M20_dimer domain-containing protein n=1 Tax=Ascaris lumbricoides TaxID=6252 RepID=A0A0M3IAV0_ASCLU
MSLDRKYDLIAKAIDANKRKFIERLREAVAIQSVSAEPEHRQDVIKMLDWKLESLGAITENVPLGKQTLPNGMTLTLPPGLFATLGNDPKKKTLLIYGHLDNGKLYGRGATDDKGPIMAWLNAIEMFHSTKVDIPVNIKFCLEGMEESGSLGLEEALNARKNTWLSDVDFTCISDNYWLGTSKPCITYGLRGVSYFSIEITGSNQDLHSGTYGGNVFEPLADLMWMLAQLTDLDGTILIDGIYDLVSKVTVEERKLYEAIDFDQDIMLERKEVIYLQEQCRRTIGAKKLSRSSKSELLMNIWRYPSLSIHGIEGAFDGQGAKTVIPAKVIGKFSIRLVPNMDGETVEKLVIKYLDKIWQQRNSPNSYRSYQNHTGRYWLTDFKHPHYQCGVRAIKRGIEGAFDGQGAKTVIPAKVIGKFSIRLVPNMDGETVEKLVIKYLDKIWQQRNSPNSYRSYQNHTGRYWLTDFKHPHYQCGVRAIKRVFGTTPDYTREGCSIPIALTFEELTGNNVMLLPIGAGDDMAHSQNEKINIRNYIEGTKMLAAYLLELGSI